MAPALSGDRTRLRVHNTHHAADTTADLYHRPETLAASKEKIVPTAGLVC